MPLPIDTKDFFSYAVIGRLNSNLDPDNSDQEDVMRGIMEHIAIYIDPSDISYDGPSFIVHVRDPMTQVAILSDPIVGVGQSTLEMVPWSKEHEWAKIPWITATSPRIIIDPLKILPLVSSRSVRTGVCKLKDSFASKMTAGYELKAPDYSYLLIAELKDFYNKKYSIFSQCVKISEDMSMMLEELYALIKGVASNSCKCEVDSDQCASRGIDSCNKAVLLQKVQTLLCASAGGHVHDTMLAALDRKKFTPLQLDSFIDEPMNCEVPLPETYTGRLKTIFIEAVEEIYKTKPIIETIEVMRGDFQTFITIGNSTHRHDGGHKRSAVEQEAAAIYYSLKYISHILGHSIVDLNYPILNSLIGHINKWNCEINILHYHIGFIQAETERINEALKYIFPGDRDIFLGEICCCFRDAVEKLLSLSAKHLMAMMDMSWKFLELKYLTCKEKAWTWQRRCD